ncbi:chitinase-like protein 3 [Ornithodoros turicata]|uniref:chitinase-like protein 3 n=1 Tax=Ornithodoros turicata TaxID=34597 RepID=UPI003138FA6A
MIVTDLPACTLRCSLMRTPTYLWMCALISSGQQASIKEKPLWCFYTPHTPSSNVTYQPVDIPVEYCSVVAYAYIGLTDSGRNLSSLHPEIDYGSGGFYKLKGLKEKQLDLLIYLAIGGSETDSALFGIAVEDASVRAELINSIVLWLNYFDYDGVVLHIDHPESYTTTDNTNDLIMAMGNILKGHRKGFSVILPPEASRRNTLFSPFDYAVMLDVYVIQWSHNILESPDVPSCPAPLYADDGLSVAGILNSILSSYDTRRLQTMLNKFMFTFSFAGLKYHIHKPTGRHRKLRPVRRMAAVDLRSATTVAYHEICENVVRRRWNSTYNAESGCMDSGDLSTWVSYPGRPPRSILSLIGGAVAFDLQMDDFMGLCGRKNPLTRTLYHLLNK